MEKTFTYAGVSTLNGVVKARFANDAARVKVLQKNGHKEIDLIELPSPLTKAEAVEYLLSIDFDNGNAVVRQTLEAEQEKRTETPEDASKDKPSKEPKKPKKPKPVSEIELPEVEAVATEQVTQLEDAPF